MDIYSINIKLGEHTFSTEELGELFTYLLKKKKQEEASEKLIKEFTEKVIKGDYPTPNIINKEQ